MDEKYKSYCREGACPSIIINNASNLTLKQTIDVAERILQTIKNGVALDAEDSNENGNKYTCCNWGFCSCSKGHYPTADLHRFPKDFDDYGRMSALATPAACPMRTVDDYNGCFWSCRIFQRKLKTPTRDEAIALWENLIGKMKEVDNVE